MSFLNQLPEFVSGQQLAKAGKWAAAVTDFKRCSDVMDHANAPKEAAVCGMYAATCDYYSGNAEHARLTFASIAQAGHDGVLNALARRYKVATEIELGLADPNWTPKTADVDSADPWVQLSLGQEPDVGSYAHSVWEYIRSSGSSPSPAQGTAGLEAMARAHGLLTVASSAVTALPKANTDNADVSEQTELVSGALKAGEAIAVLSGPEYAVISKWYIGRSLLLRGRVFGFNGNALMAEGMYKGASDVTNHHQPVPQTPRIKLLRTMANHHLGSLLLKWEKREREGEDLMNVNVVPDGVDQKLDVFIPQPTLDELDKVLGA